MKQVKIRRSRGFTLIELGIALALIGIGLFFVISKLNETSDASKAQNLVSDLSGIITNTKRLYATQQSYNGVAIGTLRDNAVFPTAWNNAGTITGPFTGAVTVAAATLSTADDSATITIPNIPSRVCTEIARMMSEGVNVMSVAGTTVKPNNGTLNVATLGTQCVSATSVAMGFTFGRM